MDPQPAASDVEARLRDLRGVDTKARLEEVSYSTYLNALFEAVFDEDGLYSIGDLATLDRIWELARLSDCENHYPDYFERLEDHRANVADVHAKLAAILDLVVPIREILYGELDSWHVLTSPVGVAFDTATQQEFQAVRSASDRSSVRLDRFFDIYHDNLVRADRTEAATRLESLVKSVLSSLQRQEDRYTTTALFYDPNTNNGCYCRVVMSLHPSDKLHMTTDIDATPEMERAVRSAVHYALQSSKSHTDRYLVRWSIDELRRFEGASIGLAAAIGALALSRNVTLDAYTAFTGEVLFDNGRVSAVGYVPEKLRAAKKSGFRRVYVPKDTITDEIRALESDAFKVIGVDTVEEVWDSLHSKVSSTPRGTSFPTLIREFELECANAHIDVINRQQEDHDSKWTQVNLSVTDGRDRGRVVIYDSKRGVSAVIEVKPNTPLHSALERVKVGVFGTGSHRASPDKSKPQSYRAYSPKRERIQSRIREVGHFQVRQEANCEYRLDFADRGERVIVRQYLNGNLTVQQVASGPGDDPLYSAICGNIEAVLDLAPHESGSISVAHQQQAADNVSVAPGAQPSIWRSGHEPWIGSDESGKGDYFGPLVCAAVCVDQQIAEALQAIGVRDSKALTDGKARQLAERIRDICRGRYAEVEIGPEKYNQLYEAFRAEGKNLTLLLSWGHARVLENLLEQIDARHIIVDQYADERYLRSKLLERGRESSREFHVMPKAEADPAVAAASILARDRFLGWLERESQHYGFTLPKGVSDNVLRVARAIVAQHGPDELRKVTKLHFRTTESVLGTP